MSSHQEDLDLLLFLQDGVLETPPGSPSNFLSSSSGYASDDGSPRQRGQVNMSAFRNVVQDCLDYEPKPVEKTEKPKISKNSNDPEVEKFFTNALQFVIFSCRNLRTAFRNPLKSEGVYLVDPLTDRTNLKKPKQPAKILSVEGLKKALSNAGKVTTNTNSQGIRFLAQMAGKMGPKTVNKETIMPDRQITNLEKRKSSTVKLDPSVVINRQPDTKRKKPDQGQEFADKTKMGTER